MIYIETHPNKHVTKEGGHGIVSSDGKIGNDLKAFADNLSCYNEDNDADMCVIYGYYQTPYTVFRPHITSKCCLELCYAMSYSGCTRKDFLFDSHI